MLGKVLLDKHCVFVFNTVFRVNPEIKSALCRHSHCFLNAVFFCCSCFKMPIQNGLKLFLQESFSQSMYILFINLTTITSPCDIPTMNSTF